MRYFILSILAVFIFSVQGIARNTTAVRSASTQSSSEATTTQKVERNNDIALEKSCNIGYKLKNNKCVKVYCKGSSPLISPNIKKVKSTTTTNSLTLNSTLKTKEVLNKKEKCFDIFVSKCAKGYTASKDKKECIKETLKECSWKPSTQNVEKFGEKVVKDCLAKVIIKCKDGFELIGEDQKAKCEAKEEEITKECSYKASSRGVKTWKSFEDTQKKCIAQIPETCETNYGLDRPDTSRTRCKKMKVRKGSTRN